MSECIYRKSVNTYVRFVIEIAKNSLNAVNYRIFLHFIYIVYEQWTQYLSDSKIRIISVFQRGSFYVTTSIHFNVV